MCREPPLLSTSSLTGIEGGHGEVNMVLKREKDNWNKVEKKEYKRVCNLTKLVYTKFILIIAYTNRSGLLATSWKLNFF